MNETDSNGKLPQMPVLTPETLAPKGAEISVPSEAVTPSQEPEQATSKSHRSMKILIGSLAVLLLAGAVTIAILAKTGAFSKEKEVSAGQGTSSETLNAEEGSAAEPEQEQTGPHEPVLSLSQVTDRQFEFMDQLAREYIRMDGEGMPDEVVIDDMCYLGMLRQDTVYAERAEDEKSMIQMVYQVKVTDNTGAEPVKRQFFWMYGFSYVYQDGTINPNGTESMVDTLCFDNWTVPGALNIELLLRQAEKWYNLEEIGIDYSLIQPSEYGENKHYDLVKSLDQITPAMEEGFRKGAEEWMEYGTVRVGCTANGIVLDNMEYEGLILTLTRNSAENRVYIVYRLDITDQNQTPEVKRSVYWYVGFDGIFEGGEIQTVSSTSQIYDSWSLSDWADGPASIDALREVIQHEEAVGWSYEDSFEEEAI